MVSMEVLQTIVTEVECIVNDRPLTYTSIDPNDQEPLTPSQLIYGRRITSLAYPAMNDMDTPADNPVDDIDHTSANKLYRFKSAALEQFWARWKHEYVTSLREHHRRFGKTGDIVKVGTVVQIHDDNLPRGRWSLGVVQDVLPGRDGSIRAAIIRSRRGVTTRPISKLYPLEVQ